MLAGEKASDKAAGAFVGNSDEAVEGTMLPGDSAVGVLAALQHTGGVWFGWSGETSDAPAADPAVITRGKVRFAGEAVDPWGGQRAVFSATGRVDRRTSAAPGTWSSRPAESWYRAR